MVSRFQTALRYAIREKGSVSLERWNSDGTLRDAVSVEHEASTERIPIAPDAFFTLRFPNEPEGRNRVHVFLEADCGSMTTKRFFVKMRGYWHWWRSGRAEERFGVKNFQVLTIARTTERAASLFDAARALDAPRHRGLRPFLFGSEREYVGGPMRVLEAIWATPGDRKCHSLLE